MCMKWPKKAPLTKVIPIRAIAGFKHDGRVERDLIIGESLQKVARAIRYDEADTDTRVAARRRVIDGNAIDLEAR